MNSKVDLEEVTNRYVNRRHGLWHLSSVGTMPPVNNILIDDTIIPLLSYTLKTQGLIISALLDSGASLNCISSALVDKHKLFKHAYSTPISVGMATAGNEFELTHYCELPYKIGQFTDKVQLAILPSITNFDVILGLPWMRKVNPLIPNWQNPIRIVTGQSPKKGKALKRVSRDKP